VQEDTRVPTGMEGGSREKFAGDLRGICSLSEGPEGMEQSEPVLSDKTSVTN